MLTLHAALRWAARQKWISHEPYVPAPPQPKPRDRWLTRDEYDPLLDAAQALHVRLLIELALHTGARRGALLDLTWSQVDFETGLIDLGDGVGKKERAIIPMNPDLLAAMRRGR
nr:tyrosine-type recombinase/integrase [uncultured Lichenicoccus sp.]